MMFRINGLTSACRIGVLVAATAFAGTSHAEGEFRGTGCVIQVNDFCQGIVDLGDCMTVRFTPPNVLGNPNRTSVAIHWPGYAVNYRVEGSAVGAAYKPVTFSWVGRSGGIATDSRTKIRIPLVQPANYAQPWVHAVIDVYRYDDFGPSEPTLCNARFRFTGQRPPSAPAAAPAGVPALASGLGNEGIGFKSPDASTDTSGK